MRAARGAAVRAAALAALLALLVAAASAQSIRRWNFQNSANRYAELGGDTTSPLSLVGDAPFGAVSFPTVTVGTVNGVNYGTRVAAYGPVGSKLRLLNHKFNASNYHIRMVAKMHTEATYQSILMFEHTDNHIFLKYGTVGTPSSAYITWYTISSSAIFTHNLGVWYEWLYSRVGTTHSLSINGVPTWFFNDSVTPHTFLNADSNGVSFFKDEVMANNVDETDVTVAHIEIASGTTLPPVAAPLGDLTPPSVTTLTIASSQVGNTGFARSIHSIVVSFTASETIGTPTAATVGGVSATIGGSSPSFTLTVPASSFSSGAVVNSWAFTIADVSGNSASFTQANRTVTSGASSVTVDLVAPSVTALTIASSQVGNPGFARASDSIVVNVTASETVGTPTAATVGGVSATIGGSSPSFTLTVPASSFSTGTVVNSWAFTITDTAGNSASFTQSTAGATSGASSVTVDLVAPGRSALTIASTNGADNTRAYPADSVVLSLTTDEPVASVTGSIGGQSAAVVSGSTTSFTLTVASSALTAGAVSSLSVSLTDLAGNTAALTFASLTGGSVTVFKIAPAFAAGSPSLSAPTETAISVSFSFSAAATTTTYCAAVASGQAGSLASSASALRSAVLAATLAAPVVSRASGSSSPLSLTGVSGKTQYDVVCVAYDGLGNAQAAVSQASITTPDLTPPAPLVSAVVETANGSEARVTVEYAEYVSVFCVAVLNSSSTTFSTGPAVKAAAQAVPTGEVRAVFVSSAAASSQAVVFSGLRPATLYRAYCAAEDSAASKRRVSPLGNVQTAPDVFTVFSQACAAGNSTARVPIMASSSGVSGTTVTLSFTSSRHFFTHAFRFVGSSNCALAQTATGSSVSAPWSYVPTATSCDDTWTFTGDLAATLRDCGFSLTAPSAEDPLFDEYRATVEATVVESNGQVFGGAQNRTFVESVRVGVRVPKSATAQAGSAAFGSVIQFAQVTAQSVDTAHSNNLTVSLSTSVQFPYELVPSTTTLASSSQTVQALVGPSASSAACSGSGACTQSFRVGVQPQSSACSVDTTVSLVFAVRCRSGYTGSCDLPVPSSVPFSFALKTDDFCARIVEVADVQPSLEVYGSALARQNRVANSQATDAQSGSDLFYRLDLVPEGAVTITSVDLRDVTIRSFCSNCNAEVNPVKSFSLNQDGGDAAPSSFGWSVSQAGPRTDFQFTLNSGSVHFDNDEPSGAVNVAVVVTARVVYTDAAGQAKASTVRAQASSSSLSGSASATSRQIGVSSGSGSGGTSTAGSSAGGLGGVSSGTVVAGVAAFAAIVALAVGAAVVGRRRRTARSLASSQAKHSASQVQLTAGGALEGESGSESAAVPVSDLQTVASAYESTSENSALF